MICPIFDYDGFLKILADSQDISAYIKRSDSENKSMKILERYTQLEQLLLNLVTDEPQTLNLKEINEQAEQQGIKGTSVKSLKTVLFYWTIRGFIQKTNNQTEKAREIIPKIEMVKLTELFFSRIALAKFIVGFLYEKAYGLPANQKGETQVLFSVLELQEAFNAQLTTVTPVTADAIQDALLFLTKIEALTLEGGFLVLYQTMHIRRLEMDNRIQYKQDDYRQLNEYYKQKIQMIHTVGEYANMMVRNYEDALQFVSDYFQMDYKAFLSKYFKGNRMGEINRNITPQKYNELMGKLSDRQREIIDDETSQKKADLGIAQRLGSNFERKTIICSNWRKIFRRRNAFQSCAGNAEQFACKRVSCPVSASTFCGRMA